MYALAISRDGRSVAHSHARADVFGDLYKAGPGSRGGRIIGYSKAGKPIYASKFSPNLDDDGHKKAAELHDNEADKEARKAGDETRKEIIDHHRRLAEQHRDAMKGKDKGAKNAKGAKPPTPIAKSYALAIAPDGSAGLALLKAVDAPAIEKSPGGSSAGEAIYYTQNGGSVYPPAGVVQPNGMGITVHNLGWGCALRVRKIDNWETASADSSDERYEVAAHNYEGWGWRAGKAANSYRDIFAKDLTKDAADKLLAKVSREHAKEMKRLGIAPENTTMAAKDVANSVLLRLYYAYKQEAFNKAGKEWAPAAKIFGQYGKLHGYKLEERAKAAKLFYENGYDDHDQTVGSVLDKLQELQNRASGVNNNRYGLAGIGRLRE